MCTQVCALVYLKVHVKLNNMDITLRYHIYFLKNVIIKIKNIYVKKECRSSGKYSEPITFD